jgi:hypothetical protein
MAIIQIYKGEWIMKSPFRLLFAFGFLLLLVSLACRGGSAPATTSPAATKPPSVAQPTKESAPAATDAPASSGGNSSGLVTFTDQNKFAEFDLPGDWTHKSGSGTHYYYDTFTSPAGDAKMENLVYNDDTPFVANQNGKFALGLLHRIYSSTGKEGDISITNDSIQSDGSERLTWKSKGGGYSGMSFFEIRGDDHKTFLMLTAWWKNDTKQATLDIINAAIASYHIP